MMKGLLGIVTIEQIADAEDAYYLGQAHMEIAERHGLRPHEVHAEWNRAGGQWEFIQSGSVRPSGEATATLSPSEVPTQPWHQRLLTWLRRSRRAT